MNPHTFRLKCSGLLERVVTEVAIGRSERYCQKRGLAPRMFDGKALWDTGATSSCISRGYARRLGLEEVASCDVIGYGGMKESSMYLVDIKLPNHITVGNIMVTEFDDNDKFDVVIGMDIITLGDISLTNYNRESVFCFVYPPEPREEKIA